MTVSTTFARLARRLLNRGRSGDFAVPETTREAPGHVYYQMAGKKRKAHGTWYRGETTNFHPMRASLAEPDAVLKYVGHGWFPAQPFITKNHYITAFGSCFAAEVTKFLVAEGYSVFGKDLTLNAHVVRSGEGITSSAALRQQFEWAFCDQAPINPVWYEKDGTAAAATGPIRDATRQIFDATDVFIFTLGLSEVWYDKLTDEVFWRAIPSQVYDPERHGFRVLGTDENRANLKRVYELIRLHRPEASIIFTLSPVPLAATFRPVSCITANSVSKASLRVAIDELMRENEADAGLHYFPSYEIVKDFLESPMEDDLRHPTRKTVDFIMRTFQRTFLM